jgi:peroxiredoxin
MHKLKNGDLFPNIVVDAIGVGRISLPAYLHRHYGVVLFYRGSWCPYCNAQLAAFERSAGQLAELDIRVVALSVDDEATTRAMAEKRRITFPLGFGADAAALEALTGAYVSANPVYLQSTGFVLGPDGRVITAVYSSNAIGRLLPEDVVGFIKHMQDAA